MSWWAGTCNLVVKTVVKDSFGVQKDAEVPGETIPCNVYSMGTNAYMTAAAAGVHPVAVLQIRKAAYNGERLVDFNGDRLQVYRVDSSSPDFVKLTLTERIGDRG